MQGTRPPPPPSAGGPLLLRAVVMRLLLLLEDVWLQPRIRRPHSQRGHGNTVLLQSSSLQEVEPGKGGEEKGKAIEAQQQQPTAASAANPAKREHEGRETEPKQAPEKKDRHSLQNRITFPRGESLSHAVERAGSSRRHRPREIGAKKANSEGRCGGGASDLCMSPQHSSKASAESPASSSRSLGQLLPPVVGA